MPAPAFAAADYLRALQALMPRGRAWPRDTDSTQAATLTGVAAEFVRSNTSANTLLVESFPSTAGEMLVEWESALGLPGIYGVTPGTTAGRQQAVVAALTDTGGQSASYFIGLAAKIGVTITITQFKPWNVNAAVNVPIWHDDWAHAWQVNGPASAAQSYTVTADVVPAAAGFGVPLLDAILGKFKPAHSVVITSYT